MRTRPYGSLRLYRSSRILSFLAILTPVVAAAGPVSPSLSVAPITWNVVGLDSNDVNIGPDSFLVGVRVSNTGDAAASNVVCSYVWDSSNANVNLTGPSTLTLSSLAAGNSADFYFNVKVTRVASAYFTARRYHITASADGVSTVSTPTPREIYVEKLISQSRNKIVDITGPSTVTVGTTVTYVLNSKTATNGYPQLVHFLDFPNTVFQVVTSTSTYTAPPGGTNDKVYADASGWDNDPNSPTYRSSIGPANYSGGKAGGTISTTFTVKIVGSGSVNLTGLIYDFSGSSYHYNSDFGVTVLAVTASHPSVSVAASDPSATEAATTTGQFTFSRTGDTSIPLTVNYTVGGTATSGSDYAALSGSVTIPTSAASATVTVTPVDDGTFEGAETVVATVATGTGYTVGSPSSATVSIADDEAPPTILINDVTAAEGSGSGTTSFTFTVTLSFSSPLTTTVDYATANGTATSGSDYTATSGTLTIPPSTLSGTITVTVGKDSGVEADETFFVNLSNAVNGTIADGQGQGTIVNDDIEVTVTATDSNASEPGTNTGTFTFSRTGDTAPALTVNYTVGGTAASGSDYTALSGSVTIPASAASATVTVTPLDDGSVEGAETVVVTIASGTGYTIGSPSSATVNIADDEAPPTISINDVTLAEGNGSGTTSFTFTVTLSTTSGSDVSVDYATANGTAASGSDYTATSGTLTISSGGLTGTITVSVTKDGTLEGDETFFVNLSNAVNATIADAQGQGTIANDDIEVTVSATDASASEPGTNTGTFTFSRTGDTSIPLTVNYTVAGTATSGSDYTALSGSVTIPASAASATVTVTPVDDGSFEGAETVAVTVASGTGYTIGSPSNATVTIADNEAPPTILINDVSAAEGSGSGTTSFTFTVTLSFSSPAETKVDYATANGTATSGSDYTATSGTLTIPPSTLSGTITVPVNKDGEAEGDETFLVNLSNAVNATLADAQGQGTIANDDTGVTVAATDANASELGSNTGTFTVSRIGDTTSSLTVNYTVGGTAASGSDYTALSGSVTIPASAASATVTVTPVADGSHEVAETVVLTLGSGTGYSVGSPSSATVTIASDDPPEANPDSYTVANGSGAAYLPVLSNDVDAIHLLRISSFTAPASGILTLTGGGTGFTYLPATGFTGVVSFPYTIDDDAGGSATTTVTITVTAQSPLVIEIEGGVAGVAGPDPTTTILPSGTAGALYQAAPFGQGGVSPYAWALVSSSPSFPFALDSATGRVVGTPPAGTYTFTLQATDSQTSASSDVRTFQVTVNPAGGTPIVSASPAPPDGTVGIPYSHFFVATGGKPQYSWTVVGGSLPAGLTLNSFTGEVLGTPTTAGTSAFTLRVTDADGVVATQPFSITIGANPVRITTLSLAGGSVGAPYHQFVQSSGGLGPTFTWTKTEGSLPPGVALSGTGATAVLSGTPTTSGIFEFEITVTDGGQSWISDSRLYQVVVKAAGAGTPRITTEFLPRGTVGAGYSTRLTGAGGTLPYSWSIVTGTLPTGLALDPATGLITGTPTAAGCSGITVRLTDGTGATDVKDYTLVIVAPPTIVTPSPLIAGTVGVGYGTPIQAVGGQGPLSWSVQTPGGSETGLPPGLGLSAFSGMVQGTPTLAGSYTFTLKVTDANGLTDTAAYSMTVLAAPGANVKVLTRSLPKGKVGAPYATTLLAGGGDPPYTWSIILGSLPSWAGFDAGTGTVFGTPDAAGTINLRFRVLDASAGLDDSVVMPLVVEDAVAISTPSVPDGFVDQAYSKPLDGIGGIGPYTWTVALGEIPPGLGLDGTTGVLSGVPGKTGTWSFRVLLVDAEGRRTEKWFTAAIVAGSSEGGVPGIAGYCYTRLPQGPPRPDGLFAFAVILLALRIWRRRSRSDAIGCDS